MAPISIKLNTFILVFTTLPLFMHITDLPLAQKRSFTTQKSVFVDNYYIYKGPYCPGERAYTNVKRCFALLNAFHKQLDIPPHLSTIPPLVDEIEHVKGIFLVFRNVGLNVLEDIPTENVSTNVDLVREVYPRSSFVKRVSDIHEEGLTEDIILAIHQHLYFSYVLGINDVGVHNILLCDDYKGPTGKQLVVGIDLDDDVFSENEVDINNSNCDNSSSFADCEYILRESSIAECLYRKDSNFKHRHVLSQWLEYNLDKIRVLTESDVNIKEVYGKTREDVIQARVEHFNKLASDTIQIVD